MTGLDVYETYNCGKLLSVDLELQDDKVKKWVQVWEGKVDNDMPETSRIQRIDIPRSLFSTTRVRLNADCTNSKSWYEVDCVRLRGTKTNGVITLCFPFFLLFKKIILFL